MPNSYHPTDDSFASAADPCESELAEIHSLYSDFLDDDSRLCSDEELRDACECVRAVMH